MESWSKSLFVFQWLQRIFNWFYVVIIREDRMSLKLRWLHFESWSFMFDLNAGEITDGASSCMCCCSSKKKMIKIGGTCCYSHSPTATVIAKEKKSNDQLSWSGELISSRRQQMAPVVEEASGANEEKWAKNIDEITTDLTDCVYVVVESVAGAWLELHELFNRKSLMKIKNKNQLTQTWLAQSISNIRQIDSFRRQSWLKPIKVKLKTRRICWFLSNEELC